MPGRRHLGVVCALTFAAGCAQPPPAHAPEIRARAAEAMPAPKTEAKSEPAWPSLREPPAIEPDGASDAAVVVAIEHYVFVPGVPGADTNATDWYSFLVDGRKIPVERVHLVRDRDATRERIAKSIDVAAGEVGPHGKLWFVFIGHGAPAKDGKDGLLVGADAQETADGLYARSLPEGDVLAALAKAPGAVALVDACFSGQTAAGAALAPGLMPIVVTKAPASFRNVTLLSAGEPAELAGPLPGADRPAFSYLALGALRGWGDDDGDGAVTAREAVDYARKALGMLPIGRSQTPAVTGADPAMVLARRAAEAGPRLQDMLPDVAPRVPAKVEVQVARVGGFALDSDPPPPGQLLLDFEPVRPGEQWTLVSEKNEPVCTLPCKRWVPPQHNALWLRLEADSGDDVETIAVPEIPYTPGQTIRAVAAPKRGMPFYGVTIATVSGIGGIIATVVGALKVGKAASACSANPQDPECDSGRPTGIAYATIGGVLDATSAGLFAWAGWSRFQSKVELNREPAATVAVNPFGVSGTF